MASIPTFDIRPLMQRARIETARELGDRCGVNRKAIHNRARRGLTWAEADEYAIRCGYFPWEIWPEWADVNPADLMPPICPVHHNDFAVELDNLDLACGACNSPVPIAA